MNRILEFHNILESAKKKSAEILKNHSVSMTKEGHNDCIEDNRIYLGDNVDAIIHLLENGYGGSLDLVYIDPPFFSGSDYRKRISLKTENEHIVFYNLTYRDTWEKGLMDYLEMISIRLFLIKKLLSEKGSIYVHVDYRTSHYIRLILDEVFGQDRFLNEIIWSYKSGGAGRKSYSKKHDNILVYTKTKNYIFNPKKEKSYNRGMKPYRFKNVIEYEDKLGWYTLVNMKDVWSLDMVGRTSSERVGYQTQKPEALLERIIHVSSNENSIVGDFFMGSGTTIKVAKDKNRRWVGADNSIQSITTTGRRLGIDSCYSFYEKASINKGILDFNLKATRKNGSVVIKIKNIRISDNSIIDNSSDPEKAEKLLKENPENFVEYLGVYIENNYKKCVWKAYGLEVKTNLTLEDFNFDVNEVIVRLIDIFGNVSEKRQEVQYENNRRT